MTTTTLTEAQVVTSSYHPDARSFRAGSDQFKVRLNPETLAKITEIQKHHASLGRPRSMELALAEAVAVYYAELLEEGLVPPL